MTTQPHCCEIYDLRFTIYDFRLCASIQLNSPQRTQRTQRTDWVRAVLLETKSFLCVLCVLCGEIRVPVASFSRDAQLWIPACAGMTVPPNRQSEMRTQRISVAAGSGVACACAAPLAARARDFTRYSCSTGT